MQYDISLIHKILSEIEGGRDPWELSGEGNHDSQTVTGHIRALIQHKLVECEDKAHKSIQGLTHEGRRFLTAIRDENVRERIREIMKKLGEEMKSEIVMEIVKDAVLEML